MQLLRNMIMGMAVLLPPMVAAQDMPTSVNVICSNQSVTKAYDRELLVERPVLKGGQDQGFSLPPEEAIQVLTDNLQRILADASESGCYSAGLKIYLDHFSIPKITDLTLLPTAIANCSFVEIPYRAIHFVYQGKAQWIVISRTAVWALDEKGAIAFFPSKTIACIDAETAGAAAETCAESLERETAPDRIIIPAANNDNARGPPAGPGAQRDRAVAGFPDACR